MTHIDGILKVVPDLGKRKILDLGAGRGDFLIDATKRGYDAEGVEYNPRYIATANENATNNGVLISIKQGKGEALPYENNSFDFINAAEVIEHVQDPDKVLSEMNRVLRDGGIAYVSIPNRFGFIDPHYHIPCVNWLPRFLSESFLRVFGKQKNYEKDDSGHQKLSDMHYRTLSAFKKMCRKHEFKFYESREQKIKKLTILLLPIYKLYAFFFIPTFHGFVYVTKQYGN